MAPSEQMSAPALQALLKDGGLTGEWLVDPRRSSIELKSSIMWGMIPVKGVFGEVGGSGTVSPDGEISGTLTLAAASIKTKNSRRDRHLRSADFFDSDNDPDIKFTVSDIRLSGRGITVTGVLTVRDRTRTLSFDAAASVPGAREAWLDAEVHINRADFGLTWNRLGMVSMNNALTIHAVFTRQ